MLATKGKGIEINQQDGTPLTSNHNFYWDPFLANILLFDAHEFCPRVSFERSPDSRDFHATFMQSSQDKENASDAGQTAFNSELCGTSQSLEEPNVRIPEQDIDAFIEAIDRIHLKSGRTDTSSDARDFMMNLRIPDPLAMKSAWRVSTGFNRNLLVLWGYSASGDNSTILPLTPTSSKWADSAMRVDLKKRLAAAGLLSPSKFNWMKFLRYLLAALAIILLLILLILGIWALASRPSSPKEQPTSGQTTADDAMDMAQKAQADAQEAIQKSEKAQELINSGNLAEAKKLVDEAQEKAKEAEEKALEAQDKVQKAEKEARLKELEAEKAEQEAKLKEKEAEAAKTEAEESNDPEKEKAAAEAEAKAVEAQEKADKVRNDAENTKAEAKEAEAEANNAETRAKQAQLIADNARKQVDEAGKKTVEEPKTEEPKTVEEPKTEEPKTEEPKTVEEPKTEEPKTEEPKTEEPKTEEPETVEEPKTEEPKTEESETVEEPKTEEPKTEEPKTEEPETVEEPKTEEPKTEESETVEEPKTEEPKTEEPKTEESETVEEPKTEEPKTVEEPPTEEPETVEDESKAAEAQKKAEEAKNDANEAKDKAEEVQTGAEEATNKADEATNKANDAQKKAEEAQQLAEQASENQDPDAAKEAIKKAEEAQDDAKKAQDDAKKAQDDADEAQKDAEKTQADAEEAAAKAKEAQDEAAKAGNQKAQDDAKKAQDDADAAKAKAEQARIDAAKAKIAAQEAEANAIAAQKLADEAEEMARKAAVPRCPTCNSALREDGTCPQCTTPTILNYTFHVTKVSEKDNGDNATVTFGVTPDPSVGSVPYLVSGWAVNGQKLSDGGESFSAKLSYTRRYHVSATVTVDGKEQEVLPFQWDAAVDPVWMIRNVGNNDKEYQVLCTNSSNTKFTVVKWYRPEFRDGSGKDISQLFTSRAPETIDDGRKARYEWKQEHIGEYIMTLKADVEYTPSGSGRKPKVVQVQNSFVLINGSTPHALITGKQMQAKKSVYHCLSVLKTYDGKDAAGAPGSGTAFAITDKLLLTNYHVAVGSLPGSKPQYEVDQAKPLVLTNEEQGHEFYAMVVDSDEAGDIALLKLCDKDGNDTDEKLPAFLNVSNAAPRKGARVFSVSYPEGSNRLGEPAFVEGKIENVASEKDRGEVISHFSNILSGYSGGPLIYLDEDNTVIGVNTSLHFTDESATEREATSAMEIRKKFPKITESEN